MNYGFWSQLKKPASPDEQASRGGPFFILAPMADVTDVAFRAVIADIGKPDVFYTEFVSAHGLNSPGRDRLIKDLAIQDSDHPIVAQFFGTNPEYFYNCGKLARELGFDGVDINMGCPDRKVVKQGAGIALCKTPELAKDCIKALREGTRSTNSSDRQDLSRQVLPVSVKTRLGLYGTKEMEEWIPALLEAKPEVLTVHGRTMKEMSKVPAHWDLIGRAAEMAKGMASTGSPQDRTLVVGNGDVMSLTQGRELAEQHKLDGIMIGRGIFHNPWLFNEKVYEVEPRKRLELLLKHTRLFTQHWEGKKNFDVLKRFYKIYVSGWEGAKDLRTQLMETKNASQVEVIVSEYLKN